MCHLTNTDQAPFICQSQVIGQIRMKQTNIDFFYPTSLVHCCRAPSARRKSRTRRIHPIPLKVISFTHPFSPLSHGVVLVFLFLLAKQVGVDAESIALLYQQVVSTFPNTRITSKKNRKKSLSVLDSTVHSTYPSKLILSFHSDIAILSSVYCRTVRTAQTNRVSVDPRCALQCER